MDYFYSDMNYSDDYESSNEEEMEIEEPVIEPGILSHFMESYRPRQNWSLPDSIKYYITKNPSTPKLYEKLIKCCKYFIIKNPLIIVSKITYELDYDKNEYCTWYDEIRINLDKLSRKKIWISDTIDIVRSEDPYFFQALIPKLYRCDAKRIELHGHILSFKNFVFLASKCENFCVDEFSVINEDGSNCALEDIVQAMPNLKDFNYGFSGDLNAYKKKDKSDFHKSLKKSLTPQTVQKLIKIPHFKNLEKLNFTSVPELSDIEALFEYFKTNNKTKIWMYFTHVISKAYNSRLQKIVDEIVGTKNHKYIIPYIFFDGMSKSSNSKLSDLYYRKK